MHWRNGVGTVQGISNAPTRLTDAWQFPRDDAAASIGQYPCPHEDAIPRSRRSRALRSEVRARPTSYDPRAAGGMGRGQQDRPREEALAKAGSSARSNAPCAVAFGAKALGPWGPRKSRPLATR